MSNLNLKGLWIPIEILQIYNKKAKNIDSEKKIIYYRCINYNQHKNDKIWKK